MQINKKDIPSQIEYDLLHANAIQSWIAGNYANGTAATDGKPFNLFGSSFQVRVHAAPLLPSIPCSSRWIETTSAAPADRARRLLCCSFSFAGCASSFSMRCTPQRLSHLLIMLCRP